MEVAAEPAGLIRTYRDARWGRIVGVWAAILVFDALRTCVDAYLDHRAPSLPWLVVLATSIATWTAYTPFLFWMVRRAPFERGARARSAAEHAAAYLALTVLDSIAQAAVLRAFPATDAPAFTSIVTGTLLVDGFSYAAVVAIAEARRLSALYRERVAAQAALDRALAQAQLRALEMQLQPHFLFNTLHAVGALVRSARPDDAVRSLATLGELLRATLADDGRHEIALAERLAFARGYLDLQRIRFGDRLEVDLDIAPAVAHARVPRLILQPLLDNAIRHGVERSRAAVKLEVRARADGDRLALVVADRGGARGAPTPGQGIGLRNTRARLDALYGAAHRLDLALTDGGGLEVRIELPLAEAVS